MTMQLLLFKSMSENGVFLKPDSFSFFKKLSNHVEMKLIYLKRKNETERPLQLVKQITKL